VAPVEADVEPEFPSTFTSGATIFAMPQPNRSTLHPIPINPNLYAQQQQQQQLAYGQSMLSAPMNVPPPQQADYGYVNQQPPVPSSSEASLSIAVQEEDDSSIIDVPLPLVMAGLPARPPVANPGEDIPAVPSSTSTITLVARPAEDAPEGEPSAKRQMKEKKSDTTVALYSEEDWLNGHPVRSVSLSPFSHPFLFVLPSIWLAGVVAYQREDFGGGLFRNRLRC
jgi:hypothetical protein